MHEAQRAVGFGETLAVVAANVEPGRRIPLLGTIAAGTPLPAFQVLESIDVPGGTWQQREVFALRVRGTSMVDDGILDGDYLVVEAKTDVRDGQTVIAEVDGHATVKRLYRERDGAIRLQPANDRLLPLVLRGDRVQIRGVVVGVLRKQGFRAPASTRSQAHSSGVRRGAADLAVRILEQHVAEGNRLVSGIESRERSRGRESKALAQSLRALHATYVETSHPRLRKALLEEATRVIRQLRAIAQRTG